MALLRFTILQTIFAAALVALWLSGSADAVFAGDSRYFVFGVLAVGGIGLLLAATGRTEGAAKLQDMLPVIAVCAMQIGIIAALGVMAQALMGSGDPSKAIGGFFAALSTALYVSVASLCSYLWLKLTLWLAHGQ